MDMLNKAAMLEDIELIDYISDRLSLLFGGHGKSAMPAAAARACGGRPVTERMEAYNETTDLYQQMLWAARKIEDPKLVELLMSRLKEGAGTIFTTESGLQDHFLSMPIYTLFRLHI